MNQIVSVWLFFRMEPVGIMSDRAVCQHGFMPVLILFIKGTSDVQNIHAESVQNFHFRLRYLLHYIKILVCPPVMPSSFFKLLYAIADIPELGVLPRSSGT